MKQVSGITLASGFPYEREYPQYETLDEANDDLGREKQLRQINQKLKQDATQGPKQPVRMAVETVAEEHGFSDVIDGLGNQEQLPEEYIAILEADSRVIEAVADAQQKSADFHLGEGRGPSGGTTLKSGADLLREAKRSNPEAFEAALAALAAELES